MEDKLWRVFENINKWLEYAEKKNALILTFIGLQLTFVRTFTDKTNLTQNISIFFLGVCFFLTLLSFFPKTKIPFWVYRWSQEDKDEPAEGDNLLFYGDITKYSVNDYIQKMEKYFDGKIYGLKNLEDLCNQIVVNSQIASKKYNIFRTTTWLMIIGQLLFVISFWI